MNRPNKELLTEWSLNSYADYTNELEKYCDELEKALDKACMFMTECNNDCIPNCPFINEDSCRCKCTDENTWKEWLLEDE